ncbi:TlpA family protein disulfide reductase [Pedobacter gandavensis]|uniref:TlpA family protein disulfide reductase n=1 Tax=Pedobacter gandavensis TaxID=2679963 RepID=UPI002931E14C|nr:redoxin family protein [Pedobacter gandavensis]
MMRKIFIALGLLLSIISAKAADGLLIKGRITTVNPVVISLNTLSGKLVFKTTIDKDHPDFSMGPVQVVPDLYVLTMGATKQEVFLSNAEVTINGYFDDKDSNSSSLEFSGLEEHLEMANFAPKQSYDLNLDTAAFKALKPSQLTALAYLFKAGKYDFYQRFLVNIPLNERISESAKWLVKRTDSLKNYIVGIKAPEFQLPDQKGKLLSLKDFKGKIVVLDFWASWCVPCRREMEHLKTFYKDFEKDVQFISISLDEDPLKYKKALEEMQIPWLTIWDKKGFNNSSLGKAYGFTSIPFCMIIDANGTVLQRDINNGEVLKAALKSITK